jgi:hypothetical protein
VDHLPNGWLAAIGINVCRDGCGAWPCAGHRLRLVDARDVDKEKAVIEWQRRTLLHQYGLPITETGSPLNRGPGYSS